MPVRATATWVTRCSGSTNTGDILPPSPNQREQVPAVVWPGRCDDLSVQFRRLSEEMRGGERTRCHQCWRGLPWLDGFPERKMEIEGWREAHAHARAHSPYPERGPGQIA